MRPAAGALSPGWDLEHGFPELSGIQAPRPPPRAEGWALKVEGRWGGEKGRAVGREERRGSEQRSSGSPSKSLVPSGDTGFLCGERESKGGVHEGRRKDGDMRQGESVERKERCSSFLLSPPFSPLPLYLPEDVHALALHAAGCAAMIYLCAGAGRHGKSGLDKGIAVSPWSFF